jgi:ABC-2 family transporter protein
MFTYLIPLYYMVSKLSEEKESKSKEGMKMMGLKESVYFLSWFLLFLVVMIVMGLVIIAMIGPGLFYQSNKLLILFMCILYGIALFAESMLICSLLPNARSSATLATLFHVITYFLVYTVQNPTTRFSAKLMTSLFPNIAMALSIYTLLHFEEENKGLTFATTNDTYANYSFTEGLLMLTFDFFLYSGAGYYIDQVSSEYGVHKPWYFLCTKKYWCG